MITTELAESLVGTTAYDGSENRLGKVEQVYFDDSTSEPSWITVHTGLFGLKQTFIPLAGATVGTDRVTVAYTKDKVHEAPKVDADEHLSSDEENHLYRFYGLDSDPTADSTTRTGTTDSTTDLDDLDDRGSAAEGAGHDASGPDTDDAMTRSEERLHVGTETVAIGRVRLRKYVVTENVTQTVPVSHEEVRIEREPITDANRDDALAGGDLTTEEHEVTLHAEQPVVEKETVPVERVRLSTETVTGDEQINEEVRKEQIDTDGVDSNTDTNR